MENFKLHTIESSPEKAKPLLEQAQKDYGMLPGLYQVMADSPELLKSYFSLHELFEQTDLTTAEKTVVWMAINVENACHYCVPAHTAIAKNQGVNDQIIEALRNNQTLPDEKLEALKTFTLILWRNHGHATQQQLDTFFAAGFQSRHVLDILIGLAQKTLSNYTNHLANTPIDDAFKPFAWTPNETH